MKKLTLCAALCAALLWSCGDSKKAEDTDVYQGPTTADSLQFALATQDSLLALINEVTTDMFNLQQMEGIIGTPDLESGSVKQNLHDNMQAIQSTLQQRRERLEQLEKKLKASVRNNTVLQQTIDNLRMQIDEQEGAIASLREQLDNANRTIVAQKGEIDSLSSTLTAVNDAKEQAEEQNVQLTDNLNTCYYVVGKSKYLKDNGLIKPRFLRSTIVLPGDVDNQFFTKADKRNILEINCDSKKAKVLTNQPESSYEFITENNGNKVLVIKDQTEFWKKSPYLVIQVD